MAKKSLNSPRKSNFPLTLSIALVGSFLLFVVGLVLNFQTSADFCANSVTCIKNLTGQKEATNTGEFMGKKVAVKDIDENNLYALGETRAVLGETTADNKRIYVDLSKQRLYAYEGSTKVYDFPVSTGKWNHTPTGDFRIWVWLRYTRMAGGNQAAGTYYNLPNVPYTMYYSNASTPKAWGYSIHGAYWHNNFGQPMSHGCINMKIEDAGKIYYWTNPTAGNVAYPTEQNPGTLITVYGTTPTQ